MNGRVLVPVLPPHPVLSKAKQYVRRQSSDAIHVVPAAKPGRLTRNSLQQRQQKEHDQKQQSAGPTPRPSSSGEGVPSPGESSSPPLAAAPVGGGRVIAPFKRGSKNTGIPGKLVVLSYNILANCNTSKAPYASNAVLSWASRRQALLLEIVGPKADVLCLQDVEFFDWWQGELGNYGYDCVFCQMRNAVSSRREGIVIAWNRDMFQLFRSEELLLYRLGEDEEDDLVASRASSADNVALLCALQPWENSAHPSGLCVACAQLYEGDLRRCMDTDLNNIDDRVRQLQVRGLTQTIEVFNGDFQLPVVVSGTFNCTPASNPYEMLIHGNTPVNPSPPPTPTTPLVTVLSPASARVEWPCPPINPAVDPPVHGYWVTWCPGGSSFLRFTERRFISEMQSLVYDVVPGPDGGKKTIQNPLRSTIITGLSSGLAYEFQVCAVNELGISPWSPPSTPHYMQTIKGIEAEGRHLLGVESIKRVRQREDAHRLERQGGIIAPKDQRKYDLHKYVKVPGLVGAELAHAHTYPLASISGMTPRRSDGEEVMDQVRNKTVHGYPETTTATAVGETTGSVGSSSSASRDSLYGDGYDDEEEEEEGRQHHLVIQQQQEEKKGDHHPEAREGGALPPSSSSPPLPSVVRPSTTGKTKTNTEYLVSERESVRARARHVRCLQRSGASGARETERYVHSLELRSAYTTYSGGGEPSCTLSSDVFTGVVDYIMFTADSLVAGEVLSIPDFEELKGLDIQGTLLVPDIPHATVQPLAWEGMEAWEGEGGGEGDVSSSSVVEENSTATSGGSGSGSVSVSVSASESARADAYMGEWMPNLVANLDSMHHWLPNETFPSNHLMLLAHLYFRVDETASTWH